MKLAKHILKAAALIFLGLNATDAKAQSCISPSAELGQILYNEPYDVFQGCTHRGWLAFHVIGTGSPFPSLTFSFTPLSNANFNTLYESDIVAASGLGGPVELSISGQGTPEFRTCSAVDCSTEIETWSATEKTVDDGDFIQLRLTSSTLLGRTSRATLTDGSSVTVWDVTTQGTADCGASPPPGAICSDGTIYAGLSPDGNVPMYATRCDLGMTWDGTNCTGIATQLPWNNGNNSDYVETGMTSSTQGELNTSGLLSIDSDSAAAGIQPHQAAQACADLVIHGYDDWYLPAIGELDVLYENLQDGIPNDDNPDPVVSGFTTGTYWSSSENNNNDARTQRFSDGRQIIPNFNKVISRFLRCVRR